MDPSDIFQIYSSDLHADSYSGGNYRLSDRDRRFGYIFNKLKGEYNKSSKPRGFLFNAQNSKIALLTAKEVLVKILFAGGLYEIIFKLRPSRVLQENVKQFKPDKILAFGYSIGQCLLTLSLHKIFGIKYIVVSTDDWASYLHKSSRGAYKLQETLFAKYFSNIIFDFYNKAESVYVFNDRMARVYECKYKTKVHSFYHTTDLAFLHAPDHIFNKKLSFAIIGSFNTERYQSLVRFIEAMSHLPDVELHIYSVNCELLGSTLRGCRGVFIYDDPGDDLLIFQLRKHDFMVIIETFDDVYAGTIEFSISSKCHIFMRTAKPIFVFGHSQCGTVEYASKDGWAKVFNDFNHMDIQSHINKLIYDEEYYFESVNKAKQTLIKNHDRKNHIVL
ncbi:hypothetical protein N9E29_02175 [Porticoccaceae bacterium]|nr:hypothetical protein [Porticoccaceae bacterium]